MEFKSSQRRHKFNFSRVFNCNKVQETFSLSWNISWIYKCNHTVGIKNYKFDMKSEIYFKARLNHSFLSLSWYKQYKNLICFLYFAWPLQLCIHPNLSSFFATCLCILCISTCSVHRSLYNKFFLHSWAALYSRGGGRSSFQMKGLLYHLILVLYEKRRQQGHQKAFHHVCWAHITWNNCKSLLKDTARQSQHSH